MKIIESIEINSEPQVLWFWLTEFERLKKWNLSLLKEEHVSSGDIRKGYHTKILINEGGKDTWYENEILDYQPNRFLSVSLKGGNLGKSPMIIEYEIFQKNTIIELKYRSTWKPKEFFLIIFKPLIKKTAAKNVKNVLLELKKQIES